MQPSRLFISALPFTHPKSSSQSISVFSLQITEKNTNDRYNLDSEGFQKMAQAVAPTISGSPLEIAAYPAVPGPEVLWMKGARKKCPSPKKTERWAI